MAQLDTTNTVNPKKATTIKLSRDDFDGGPASLDEIEFGLWLGKFH